MQWLSSTLVFLYQTIKHGGGFGGGHGLDYLFFVFEMPGILIILRYFNICWEKYWYNDYVNVVAFPSFINFLLFFLISVVVYKNSKQGKMAKGILWAIPWIFVALFGLWLVFSEIAITIIDLHSFDSTNVITTIIVFLFGVCLTFLGLSKALRSRQNNKA